jgi:hypothetical protein
MKISITFATAALIGVISVDQVNAHWLDKFTLVQGQAQINVQESES